MIHHASPAFWACDDSLPATVRALADKQFALLKENPRHPSLHFKRVGRFHSVRVGAHYRALAEGMARTGGVITSAALVMIVVFASFALGDFLIIKILGFALTVAVLVDATNFWHR